MRKWDIDAGDEGRYAVIVEPSSGVVELQIDGGLNRSLDRKTAARLTFVLLAGVAVADPEYFADFLDEERGGIHAA